MKSGQKSSDQVSDQVENEAVVEKILEFCKKARTKKEISEYIGYKNLTYMTRTYIKPLLESGKLAYTIPEKPQSRLQKYVTKQSNRPHWCQAPLNFRLIGYRSL